MGRQLGVIVIVLITGLAAFANHAAAGQAQVSGSIVGRVTDESGAVLPGVTVTAKSPALQVPEVVGVTTVQGDYRLTPLPIGTFEVVFTLTGFQTVRRESIRLTAGFVARVDIVLKVGAIEESITVAASPTVDVQSTGAVTVLTKETLEVVPSSRAGLISLMNQSPAVRSQMDIGGSQSNLLPAMRVYGIGTQATSCLVRRFYGGGDVGGRIVRNKLWFYTGMRGRMNRENPLGVFAADGTPGITDQTQFMMTQKVSYQATKSQRFVFFDYYQRLIKDDPMTSNQGYETKQNNFQPQHTTKIEWQAVMGNSLVLSAQVARWRVHVTQNIAETGQPEKIDVFTTYTSGLNNGAGNIVDHYRPWASKASLGWYRPDLFAGSHDFKAGYDDVKTTSGRGWLSRPPANGGDYALQFNNGAPFQFVTYNAPNTPLTTVHSTSVYGADKWSVGRKLTLNLGVRWSRDDGYIPPQCRDAGTFFPGSCNEHIQGATQHSWSPRLYATYDVGGDGKTAIKGGWGRFADWRNGNHVLPLNPNVALQRG